MPPEIQPVLAAVVSVASLILLVTRLRVHPFPGLLIASFILGFLAGLVPTEIIKNFGKGFGDVMGSVGIIIGLGTMLGGVLVVSGGADRLAISLTSIGGKHWVPWTTFFVALLIGLPPVLMLGRSVAELAKPAGVIKQAIDFLGDPITALLVALFFLDRHARFSPWLVCGKSGRGSGKQPCSHRCSCVHRWGRRWF
jgi:H+/gluconate symporter-like permease